MKGKDIIKLNKQLISTFIEQHTLAPAMQSIDKNIDVAIRLGDYAAIITYFSKKIRIDYDCKDSDIKKIKMLESLQFTTKSLESDSKALATFMDSTCTKKCLFPFIRDQLDWICICILSANYLSARILMRSALELLINISSNINGSMKEKIESIKYYNECEKKEIGELWDTLCAWCHPYGKWIKNICPIYIANSPIYHPQHFEDCIQLFEKLVDVFIILALEHFRFDVSDFITNAVKKKINITRYKNLYKRLAG